MRSSRILATMGVLVLASGAAGIAAAVLPRETQIIETAPVEASSTIPSVVCTGGFERTFEKGLDASAVEELVTAQARAVTSGSGGQLSEDEGTESLDHVGELGFLEREGNLVGTLRSGESQSDAPSLAGVSVHVASAGDTRGVASNPCVGGAVDQWFVGSASAVGATNQLILSNPGHTSVVVRIEAFGSAGPLAMGSAGTVVVAAGSIERVDLDGVVPSDPRIALHVTTDAGMVAATLQVNELDGVKPQGVSFMTGSNAGNELVIPAVPIGDDGATPSVRLVNTEAEEAQVSVELIGPDGIDALTGGSDVAVAPGAVLDLSLAGVSPGDYALRIHSDQPIAAGALLVTETTGAGNRDMAWASAQRELSSGAVMYAGGSGTLVVSSQRDGATTVQITAIAADGTTAKPETVELNGAGSASLKLPDASVGALVESTQPIGAAVVSTTELADGQGIDWVPVFSPDKGESTRRITVTN